MKAGGRFRFGITRRERPTCAGISDCRPFAKNAKERGTHWRVAHLSFLSWTQPTTEGAPSLRFLQGWEPRTHPSEGCVRGTHPFAQNAKGWGTPSRYAARGIVKGGPPALLCSVVGSRR